MDLMNATITLADDPIIKGNRVSIKAVSGGSYSFFIKKKDGTDSLAYKQMQDMGLKKDMTVNIAYDTTQGEYQGRVIQYRNIKSFCEPSVQVDETPNPVSYGKATGKTATEQGNKPRDFDKENWGKCRYGFLIEAYKKGKPLIEAKDESAEWADVSMSEKEDLTKDEEIDVGDIPF